MDKKISGLEEIREIDAIEPANKSFTEMVREAVALAFKEGIRANSIIINKDFVKVNKNWRRVDYSAIELPEMICGLEVYLTDDELPETYSFAVLEANKTERDLLVEKTKMETAREILQSLFNMRDLYGEATKYEVRLEMHNLEELCELYGVEVE